MTKHQPVLVAENPPREENMAFPLGVLIGLGEMIGVTGV